MYVLEVFVVGIVLYLVLGVVMGVVFMCFGLGRKL